MLHRIFGRAGSGKTEYLINCLKEKQSAGADCLFLVPEQNSVDTELLLENSGATALGTEVLNFERLPNHVFRRIGGLVTENVDALGKTVLISRAAAELADDLCLYKAPRGEILQELTDTVSALKRLGISPALLEAAEKNIKASSDSSIKQKLKEAVLIYRKYQELLGNTKTDDTDGAGRLAAALKGKDFFKGTSLFIDGIYTFTPTQYELIELMAESAEDIYISFLADEDESGIFSDTLNCAEKIKKLCLGKVQDVFLTENYRTQDPALRYAETNLWQNAAPYPSETESISFAACADRYEEALRAAAEIYALRAKGYDYNSIAVACRHPQSYSGILDAVFEKYNIPFYFALKDSAATKPLGAFITGLLDMAAENAPFWAVKKYLKSSFSVLDERAADELLHYGESWRLSGKTWLTEKPWLMNPSGYRESFSPKDEALLKSINKAKAAFAQSVAPVIEALRAPDLTVAKGVRLIYDHLEEVGAAKKLAATAERLADMGDDDGGAKTAALWGLSLDILERLYDLAGDMPVNANELGALVSAMLENSNVGAIPSYTDAVSIGDARLMRSEGVKAMLILGLNEGEFPSLPKKSGVFNSKESALLEEQGIELLPPTDKAIDQERFFFYVCVAAASEYLSLSYINGNGGRASPAFNALKTLFPHNELKEFGADERDYMFCLKAAAEQLPYVKNRGLAEKLKAYLRENHALGEAYAQPLQDAEAYIKEKGVQRIRLSYSRIDCYNNCGFNYLLRYELALRDDRKIRFSAVDTGTYMHRVMEEFMKKRMESGVFVPADRKETELEIDHITSRYIETVIPAKPTKRLLKHIDRLKNVAAYVCESLCDEFSHSQFKPEGFEVEIGAGGIAPAVLISPKGRRVETRGFIDRVDSAVVDGKKYVRVVDYKSSKKTVTPAMIERGEGIQMLSYLYTYCDADTEGALPAGVLYRSFELPENGKVGTQKGIVTDNEAVLAAMDDRGKKGAVGAKPATEEELEYYKEKVFCHIKETADRIIDGDMGVRPFKKEETDCVYCPYGEVCRQEKETRRFR